MELSHRIGEGSSFDGDMDLIETFVKCSKEPDNSIIQAATHHYYISRALSYWDDTKEYISSTNILEHADMDVREASAEVIMDDIYEERNNERIKRYNISNINRFIDENIERYNDVEDLLNYYYPLPDNFETKTEKEVLKRKITNDELLAASFNVGMNSLKNMQLRNRYILNNLAIHEENFLKLLDEINKRFSETGKFDNDDIINLFIYIGKINCLMVRTGDIEKDIRTKYSAFANRIFPLVNDNGIFSLNTWLYSYFENVELLGFTSKGAEFDGRKGCSFDMFSHDFFHIQDVNRAITDRNFVVIKSVYYNIINDKTLSRREKELYILTIWYLIHETTDDHTDHLNFTYDENDFLLMKVIMKNHIFKNTNDDSSDYYFINNSNIIEEFNNYTDIVNNEENIVSTIEFLGYVAPNSVTYPEREEKIYQNLYSNYTSGTPISSQDNFVLAINYVFNNIFNKIRNGIYRIY